MALYDAPPLAPRAPELVAAFAAGLIVALVLANLYPLGVVLDRRDWRCSAFQSAPGASADASGAIPLRCTRYERLGP